MLSGHCVFRRADVPVTGSLSMLLYNETCSAVAVTLSWSPYQSPGSSTGPGGPEHRQSHPAPQRLEQP